MSNFDHLPDDATRLTSATIYSHFTTKTRDLTLIGWILRCTLLVILLGAGMVLGGLIGPVLYRLLN